MLPEKIPALIASRYRVVAPIGEGNMGTVYLVEHVYTGEELAMKVLQAHAGANPKLVKRFKREAWLPARIRSDHVVRVIDADVSPELGNVPFLVMELLRGSDLESYVQRQGPLPPSEVVGIYWQIADALSKAHALGIVHRDLKPENIFLHEHFDGRVIVKLLDFGISKMTGEGLGNIAEAGLTRTGAVLGTPLYMPPEQATGDTARIGPSSDFWALGLIAYRLLTGAIYWKSLTMAELLVEVLSKPMDPPSQRNSKVTPAFDSWFFQACNRDSTKRFASVWDLVKALAEALGIGPPVDESRVPRMVFPGEPASVEDVPSTENVVVREPQAPQAPESVPPATMPSHAVPRSERERTHTRPSSRQRHNIKLQDRDSNVPSAVPLPPPRSSEPSEAAGGTMLRLGNETLLPEAERRQLTIVAWDVLVASEPSTNVDRDKLERLTNEYKDTFVQVIARHRGQTAAPLGEGQLAYFGYPTAHEDDARRAVAAALELVETAEKLNVRQTNLRLDVRVGVHTGLVLTWEISEDASSRPAAIAGATPTLAWRLSNLARRNGVLISGTTQRLVRHFYQCQSHGLRTLKGYVQPIETFLVSDESAAQSRLQGMPTGHLTPMVGRDLELGLLLDRWARVEEGSGQVVIVMGEAGMGKSRLVRVFRDRLECVAHKWIETRCLPEHRDRQMRPVATLFSRLFVLTDEDSPLDKISKLERAVTHFGHSLDEIMPLFGELMGLPVWDRYPPIELTAEEQRGKLAEILVSAVDALGQRQPVVLMMADLHCADHATIEFLGEFSQEIATLNAMLLATARPSFTAPWVVARAHINTVTLGRLTAKRVKMMVDELTKGVELPKEVFDQLVDKTDGVPLYIEEMTKTLLESKALVERSGKYELTGAAPELTVPSTLRDALMARIDRLGSAKRVAQLAAILGREFAYDLIEAVAPMDPASLQRGLEKLVDADILHQRGRIPRATFSFKYVLMHATAYESLLHTTRQAYHRKVAQVLLERSISASQDANKSATADVDKGTAADKDERKVTDQKANELLPPQPKIRDVLRSMAEEKPGEQNLARKDWKRRPS